MKKIRLILMVVFLYSYAGAQKFEASWSSLNQRKIPEWFHQDKFGIFIHWGVYSVPAFAPVIKNSGYSYAEWYWYRINEQQKDFKAFHDRNYGPAFTYPQFEPMFRAEMFNPAEWAGIFKRSGARYVVLTSKHHEGYALWNSAEADKTWNRPWNAVTGTPHRDLLGDLTNAVRKEGLKMGYYYSLYEWFNPMWRFDKKKYVDEHMTPQFKDLVTKYKPSIIFADGEWELPDTAWHSQELLAWLFNESPVKDEVVVNDRWGSNTRGLNKGATYATSEYGSGMDASIIWEENQGIGHSYGYNRNEQLDDYKSSHDLILLLCDIVSRGGNLLLDIGPTADGRIPVIMQQRLADIGDWLKINGEAIYGTEAWKQPAQWSDGIRIPKSNENFMADYSISKMVETRKDTAHIQCFFTRKGKDLYCIVPAYSKTVLLKDFRLASPAIASVLGSETAVSWKQKGTDISINISNLKPGDISPSGVFVIKLGNGINE
jgi:alpha-L-fucosidase